MTHKCKINNSHTEEKMFQYGNLWFRNKYIPANQDKLKEP